MELYSMSPTTFLGYTFGSQMYNSIIFFWVNNDILDEINWDFNFGIWQEMKTTNQKLESTRKSMENFVS